MKRFFGTRLPIFTYVQQKQGSEIVLLWIYLLLVTLAELLTALVNPRIGIVTHVAIMIVLTVHAVLRPTTHDGRMAMALTLAPLIRVLSLSLPLNRFPLITWYAIVAVPLLLATWIVIRQLKLSRDDLGLRSGNIALQAMLMGGGVGLGMIEYAILSPAPLIGSFTWQAIIIASLILFIFTGFTEEVIFRGVMQSLALPVLGRWSIFYIALLFAVLHIGYLSAIDILFVFGVGLLFGYLVRWSGSLLGVTIVHGLTNTLLFLVMPYATQDPTGDMNTVVWWVGAVTMVTALLSVCIIGWMSWRAHRVPSGALALEPIPVIPHTSAPALATVAPLKALRPSETSPSAAMSATAIRTLRLQRGVKYVDLAARCGIPVRILAEIEHGIRPLLLDQRDQIISALDLAV